MHKVNNPATVMLTYGILAALAPPLNQACNSIIIIRSLLLRTLCANVVPPSGHSFNTCYHMHPAIPLLLQAVVTRCRRLQLIGQIICHLIFNHITRWAKVPIGPGV
jgi:hypothetical protein